MKNKGQITVFMSCMISVLIILTLTALEVGRIYCGRMKIRAVIHSAQSCILADYNRELFERYHLLFADPTYGTGSYAMVEGKFQDYVEKSLNGDASVGKLFEFEVCEIALCGYKSIIDDHMKLLKKQIADYEKEEGAVKKVVEAGKNMVDSSKDVKEAAEKTSNGATEIPMSSGNNEVSEADNISNSEEDATAKDSADNENKEEVEDPRKVLKDMLSKGVLALLLPTNIEVSNEEHDFSDSPSETYTENEKFKKDTDFTDVNNMLDILNNSAKEDSTVIMGIGQKAAFCAYVDDHFSYFGSDKGSVMKGEVEYIIKGKKSDYDNLEAVLSDIIWMRMPINYVCLLKDVEKQSEALTVATAICSSTGTLPMVEIVKYLLLGCWAYGESIYEVRLLMQGEKLPYVKTSMEWNTDLKSLTKTNNTVSSSVGMSYTDYLNIMLAQKESKDITYARLLDMIELNLRQKDENLSMVNMCGEFKIQGKIRQLPKLLKNNKNYDNNSSVYDYYFQEKISY